MECSEQTRCLALDYQDKISNLEDALSEVLYFVADANTVAPALSQWHKKHKNIIKEAAKNNGRDHLLIDIGLV